MITGKYYSGKVFALLLLIRWALYLALTIVVWEHSHWTIALNLTLLNIYKEFSRK